MDVIGLGEPFVDFLVNTYEFPKPNHGGRMLDYSWQGGGKAATALVALARLGASCGFIGCVGTCKYSSFCREDFVRHGIDTSRVIVDSNTCNPFSVVFSEVKSGFRNIIYHPGNHRELRPADIDEGYLASSRYLHLERADEVSVYAAKCARANGVKVVMDADHNTPEMEALLPWIDVFIASEFFYKSTFSGEDYETSCEKIIAMGPEIVVFTLGSQGCVGMDRAGFFIQKGIEVKVVDTTGAGDVFHGAFIYGLLQNWNLNKTAEFACAVAAIKCTRIGGRAGIPTLQQTMEFLETGRMEDTEIEERVQFYKNISI